ncbi:hypothetical protein FQN55_004865 [Onygenales sp. PD_40]|nr:hypothetical protein FQN55_004865 [Onygenales sp. PD_40]
MEPAPDADRGASEDVNDFLLRVRELGDKRDKEDEERTRKLEEQILQGRRERQARRAERARSISPTKDSPGPFDASLIADAARASPTPSHSIEPPLTLRPSSRKEDPDITPASHDIGDTDMAKPDDLPRPASRTAATSFSSTRPLSWKQRPGSRDPDAGSVPSPTFAKSTLPAVGKDEPPAHDAESSVSRNSIAQSLGSKDPSWFRQTADRGIGSPAYRRAQDSSVSDVSLMSGNTRLPGFSRESTIDSERSTNNDYGSERSRSPSRASSIYGTGTTTSSLGNRYSSVSSVSTAGGLGSPVPLSSSQRMESRGSFSNAGDSQPADRFAMSPSQGRLASDRPSSPTKGLGGFVQSAMMRRSDSVSKRWSAQSTGRGSISKPAIQTPTTLSREASDETPQLPNSRPSSSHSEATVVRHATAGKGEFVEPSKPPSRGGLPNDGFVKPSLPSRPLSRSDSISASGDKSSDLPTSPSKTMEPRRWSPTKSTWLESALNKPDSPKPKAHAPQEPEWKREIHRLKQNKASVDLGRPGSPGSFLQKENQLPPRSRDGPAQSPTGVGKREPPSPVKSDGPSLGTAPEPDNGGLRIQTSTNRSQPPEKPQKLDGWKSSSISSPKERGGSPAASSPVGSQKSSESHRTPTLDGLPSKSKPQTPPVTDFRANLRRREIPDDNSSKNEPEFKNVFGKLRRTETKNYVAPDLLKDNILRGKAGLNQTGGPKKNERVDDFKQSILKTKEAMKAGGGSIRRPTISDGGSGESEKPSPPVPEAITRRRALTKSGSISNNVLGADSLKSPKEPKSPSFESETKLSTFTPSNPPSPDKSIPPTVGAGFITPELKSTTKSSSMDSPESAAKTGIAKSVRKLPSEDLADRSAKIDPPSSLSSHKPASSTALHSDIRGPGVVSTLDPPSSLKSQQGEARAGTGKLAERLNPALAGILSRGPPPAKTESSGAANDSSSSISSRVVESSQSSTPAKLTHATKSRAKGPKRRLPQTAKSSGAPQRNEDSSPPKAESPTIQSPPDVRPINNNKSPADTSSPADDDVPTFLKQLRARQSKADISAASLNERNTSVDKPTVSSKSPALRKFTPTSNESKDGPTGGLEFLPATTYVEPESPSPPRPALRRNTSSDYFKLDRKPSPPPKTASITSPKISSSPESPQVSSNPRSLGGKEQIRSMDAETGQSAGSYKPSPLPSPLQQKNLPSSLPQRTSSPPVPRKPSNSVASRPKAPSISSKPSPFPEAAEAANLFSTFFDAAPKASDKVEVDPQTVLNSRPDVFPKITTLSTQIWEITGDGKRKDLPANQGYILYEGSMYLCVHVYEAAGGSKTTQVNLWCGDDVSEAAIEDAQLFARRVAKDNGSKLELVKQGKEAPSFIQALGGIIITRRGSSSRANSSAMYMLCGRRHMGQVAFDEVELAAKSLCSGFPFLISTAHGKLYLWQGRGSTADELGCARLIGMDIGLTGEIEEVIEGKEPAGFFDIFPDTSSSSGGSGQFELTNNVDHWKHKPNNEKYCCRLYRVDHELGQRFGSGFWSRRGTSSPVARPKDIIQEISPFCQRDLDAGHVHILDMFFEIFVIVGANANARSAEFASALVFAQEYSIMAVSLQDRPFIPKGSVVMHGLPDECKQAFRKWDERVGSGRRDAGSLGLKKGARTGVVPLNAAIEAIR